MKYFFQIVHCYLTIDTFLNSSKRVKYTAADHKGRKVVCLCGGEVTARGRRQLAQ